MTAQIISFADHRRDAAIRIKRGERYPSPQFLWAGYIFGTILLWAITAEAVRLCFPYLCLAFDEALALVAPFFA